MRLVLSKTPLLNRTSSTRDGLLVLMKPGHKETAMTTQAIDYDKCLSLQERAVEQLKTRSAPEDVRLTVELCGIVVRMLHGFEKTLGLPADDLPALQAASRALPHVAAMRALLQEWTDMTAEPSAGDGLCMTPEVAAEHQEWANRYSDLVMRTTTILRSLP